MTHRPRSGQPGASLALLWADGWAETPGALPNRQPPCGARGRSPALPLSSARARSLYHPVVPGKYDFVKVRQMLKNCT
jgi:hypothetical protein